MLQNIEVYEPAVVQSIPYLERLGAREAISAICEACTDTVCPAQDENALHCPVVVAQISAPVINSLRAELLAEL